jgi:plasmid maintenance system antidote protein VapI
MGNKTEKIYKELRKKYTDEEIVESVLFNEKLGAKEQKDIDEEFKIIRLMHLNNMSAQAKLAGSVFQMKILMKKYFGQEVFNEQYSFSNQLKKYIKLTGRNNKEIAQNLDIHPTKLSRIINGRDNPNIELMYRLEKHSDGELPAHFWWRLYSRELEYQIRTDLKKKLEEAGKVKDYLVIRG